MVPGCRTPGGTPPVAGHTGDLMLAPEQERESEALSHFAWGLFLNLQDESAWITAHGTRRRVPFLEPGGLSLSDPDATEGFTLLPPVRTTPPGDTVAPAEGAPRPAPEGPPPELPEYVKHYLQALRLEPDNRETLTLLIASLRNGSDAKSLGRELLAIADANPRSGYLALTVAELLELQGRRADAIAFLERIIPAGAWSDAQLVRKLCGYYWEAGRYDAIEPYLAEALRRKELAGNFGLRLTRATFFQQSALLPAKQKSERARKRLLKNALAAGRDALVIVQKQGTATGVVQDIDPEECLVLVRLFHVLEAYDDALKLVRASRLIFPDEDGEFDVWEVESLLKLKRQEEASVLLAKLEKKFEAFFREAEAPAAAGGPAGETPLLDLRNPEVRRQIHENNIDLGCLFVEMDKPKEAVAAYERALRIAPADFRLRFILGQLYLEMGQPDRTIEIVQGVDQLLQQKYRILSYAYHRLDKTQEAARYLGLAEEAALKAGDKRFFNKDFYLYFAAVCEEAGWIDRSIEKATKALELDPADPVVANFLGYVLADYNRDLNRAEQLVRQAVTAEPRNEAYLDSMAWVCYRQKRFAEAQDWLHKALQASGAKPDPVILDHAGDISAGLDLWTEARQYWEQALNAGTKTPEKIREKLKNAPAESPRPQPPK